MFKKSVVCAVILCAVLSGYAVLAQEAYQKETRNVDLTANDTWYPVDLKDSTSGINKIKSYTIKSRTANDIYMSYLAAGTYYFTIPAGQAFWETNINTPISFYLKGEVNSQVAEIDIKR